MLAYERQQGGSISGNFCRYVKCNFAASSLRWFSHLFALVC